MAETNEVPKGFFAKQDSPFEKRVASIAKVFLYIGASGIVIMMVLTVSHAVGRYAFNQPLRGTIEISSLLLAILIFTVGGYTQILKEHVVVGFFVDRLSKRKQAIVDSFTYMICLVIITLAFWQSLEQSIIQMKVAIMSIISGAPTATFLFIIDLSRTSIFSFIIAFGWGIFSLVILLQLRHILPVAVGRKRN